MAPHPGYHRPVVRDGALRRVQVPEALIYSDAIAAIDPKIETSARAARLALEP